MVKNPPAVQAKQETQVQFLVLEDPLEKEMATHSSILYTYIYIYVFGASLVAQLVKNSPAMQRPGRLGFNAWVGKIPWRRE